MRRRNFGLSNDFDRFERSHRRIGRAVTAIFVIVGLLFVLFFGVLIWGVTEVVQDPTGVAHGAGSIVNSFVEGVKGN